MAAQGPDMFGQVFKPTRLDIMREFARTTGVKIHEGDFVKVTNLAGVEEKRRIQRQAAPRKSTPQNAGFGLAESEQKIRDLFEAFNADNKSLSKSWYLRASPAEITDAGLGGLLLTEKTVHYMDTNGIRHALKRHGEGREHTPGQIPITEADFLKVPEIIANPDVVAYGSRTKTGGQAVVYGKALNDGTFLMVEERWEGKDLLSFKTMWKRTPGALPTETVQSALRRSEEANARSDSGPSGPSTEIRINESPTPRNFISSEASLSDRVERAKNAAIIQESINTIQSAEDSQLKRQAMAALEADPNMRIQLDDTEEGTGIAAEYLKNELQKADEISREANQSVPVAVVCALANGGLNDK